jgi:hypothetical protein
LCRNPQNVLPCMSFYKPNNILHNIQLWFWSWNQHGCKNESQINGWWKCQQQK